MKLILADDDGNVLDSWESKDTANYDLFEAVCGECAGTVKKQVREVLSKMDEEIED